MTKELYTVGMAAYGNFDEVFFTVQSLRFHHAEVMDRCEIVVVDNNPGSIDGDAIKAFVEGRVRENGRYVPFPSPKGSCPPRQHLFDVARGRFVVCLDSHVLLEPGVLKYLFDYFDANPDCDDLLHGPLVSNFGPHRLEGTHMVPRWRSEMFGTWGIDERGIDPKGEPFEIPQHGLGLFAARRESWLRFRDDLEGFSGGEGYIHEKYRQAGRRVLCLPGARWVHKFNRPHGIPHAPRRADKIKNHIRGWMELGVDLATGDRSDPIGSMASHYVGGGKMTATEFERLAAEAGFPDYRCKVEGKARGVVIGPSSFGSYRMRGRPLAEKFGLDELNSRSRITINERFDFALVVKAGVPQVVREKIPRVIWEPLDLWFSGRGSDSRPGEWLLSQWQQNKFDEIILSTVPMFEAAKRRLPSSVKCHLVPHHADPRISPDWYNASGPIVYAGNRAFVSGFEEQIRNAGDRIGREVVFDFGVHSWQSLKGAALVLCPRLAGRSRLNIEGKPTVKLANASAARIPALTTPDPASKDLFFDVRTCPVEDWRNAAKLAEVFRAALDDPPSDFQFPFERWLEQMRGILK